MDLRQLRYFVMVAEELSFSRAASRLRMSQPPLSHQIKALEEEMGVQLLHRTKREVKLTDAGKVFLSEAHLLLDQFRHAVNTAQRAAEGESGVLRLGMATSAIFHVMPTVLQRIATQFPRVTLNVIDMQSGEQLRALAQSRLDIGIVHAAPGRKGIHSLPLLSETFCMVLPENHALARKPDLTLAELADQPMVVFSREHTPSLFDALVASCLQAGFSPKVAHVARNPLTVFQMVKVGLGVSLVPRSYAQSAFAGLCFRDSPTTAGQLRLEVVWSDRHASELAITVAQQIFSTPI